MDQTIYKPAERTDHGISTTPQDTYVYTGESYVWYLILMYFRFCSDWKMLTMMMMNRPNEKNEKEVMDKTTAAAAAAAERWTTTITAAAAEQTSHQQEQPSAPE